MGAVTSKGLDGARYRKLSTRACQARLPSVHPQWKRNDTTVLFFLLQRGMVYLLACLSHYKTRHTAVTTLALDRTLTGNFSGFFLGDRLWWRDRMQACVFSADSY